MGVEVPVAAQTTRRSRRGNRVDARTQVHREAHREDRDAQSRRLGADGSRRLPVEFRPGGTAGGGSTAGGQRSFCASRRPASSRRSAATCWICGTRRATSASPRRCGYHRPLGGGPVLDGRVSITPDRYRLLYLITGTIGVVEAPKKVGSIELTRNEISSGGGSPSRTSSAGTRSIDSSRSPQAYASEAGAVRRANLN